MFKKHIILKIFFTRFSLKDAKDRQKDFSKIVSAINVNLYEFFTQRPRRISFNFFFFSKEILFSNKLDIRWFLEVFYRQPT